MDSNSQTKAQIVAGDVVTLLTGSPKLTVSSVTQDVCECVYYCDISAKFCFLHNMTLVSLQKAQLS